MMLINAGKTDCVRRPHGLPFELNARTCSGYIIFGEVWADPYNKNMNRVF